MSNGIYAETSKTNSLEPKNGSDRIGKKPEVGDVYIDTVTGVRYTIAYFDTRYWHFVAFVRYDTTVIGLLEMRGRVSKNLQYLGKAKANINDLFEVQDERSTTDIKNNRAKS